jgi:predicted Rossmann fold flavoprotein
MESWDVIILGAGAAGLFCGIEAARRGRRVLVLDHAKAPAEKIRISGGGRCNFTNMYIEPHKFIGENPRFALSALNRYTQWDFIARVDAAGIAWHEKTLGQLFCDNSAKDIIAMLTTELADAGATLRLGCAVSDVTRNASSGFVVETSAGTLGADAVVVATGGKSIPKIGASGIGYQIAENFGLRIVPTRPALVPLTFEGQLKADMATLSGTSVQATVAAGGTSFDEGLLFTHRGLSGPSILQISSYWREGDAITVDLAANTPIAAPLKAARQEAGKISIKNALARHLPEKLAVQVVARAQVSGTLADQSNAALDALDAAIHSWDVTPAGTEGYRTAEVTLGGVDTTALDARTFAARDVPGLHFIGEVVDITGWLGGYNFQWAWSSGWACGQAC